MGDNRDYWKIITGEPFEETTRTQSFEDIVDEEWLQFNTKYPLRLLGYAGDEGLRITEEQRPHTHLIGSTQEGKSKFIERFIRGDIKRGIGLCLLDPTTGGKTVYDVLRYCCYKKIKKVCLIDPYHHFDPYYTVAGINPFLYTADGRKSDKLKGYSIQDLLDTMRILFSVKDPADTPRLERYLPSVLSVLYDSQSPLRDAEYFSNQLYVEQRKERLIEADRHARVDLEEAFRNQVAYVQFQSTVNRIVRFFRGTLGLMFSVGKGIDFMRLVAEDWIILVNLDTGSGFDTLDSRLLGTYIINSIATAKERLNKRIGDESKIKPYYLYIDEASEYANRKLARTLSLKQKTGLKVTIGHQYTAQFEDKYVLDSVLANSGITAMFNVRMAKDRGLISEQFYGGKITPEMASDANADLPKQYAVIKALKGKPVRVMIPNVKEPPVSSEELRRYILDLYSAQKGWYYDARELKDKLENDYAIPTDTVRPQPGKTPHRKADSEASLPAGVRKRREQQSVLAGDEKPEKTRERRPIKI